MNQFSSSLAAVNAILVHRARDHGALVITLLLLLLYVLYLLFFFHTSCASAVVPTRVRMWNIIITRAYYNSCRACYVRDIMGDHGDLNEGKWSGRVSPRVDGHRARFNGHLIIIISCFRLLFFLPRACVKHGTSPLHSARPPAQEITQGEGEGGETLLFGLLAT